MRYKAGLETRDRILLATRRLIASEGMDGTTIKAICEEAGVLPGSFYNLFDSKEQAIMSVVRQAIDAFDPDPARVGNDSLSELVEAFIRFVIEQDDLARVYTRLAIAGMLTNPELRGRMIRHHQGRVDRFAAAISREHHGIGPQETEVRAETMVSALNGISLHRMMDTEFDVAIHARTLLDLCLR